MPTTARVATHEESTLAKVGYHGARAGMFSPRGANHEQGYGQEEGREEEAGKVSAGEAHREERKETEPRLSNLKVAVADEA
jgi:hypothetical protein